MALKITKEFRIEELGEHKYYTNQMLESLVSEVQMGLPIWVTYILGTTVSDINRVKG